MPQGDGSPHRSIPTDGHGGIPQGSVTPPTDVATPSALPPQVPGTPPMKVPVPDGNPTVPSAPSPPALPTQGSSATDYRLLPLPPSSSVTPGSQGTGVPSGTPQPSPGALEVRPTAPAPPTSQETSSQAPVRSTPSVAGPDGAIPLPPLQRDPAMSSRSMPNLSRAALLGGCLLALPSAPVPAFTPQTEGTSATTRPLMTHPAAGNPNGQTGPVSVHPSSLPRHSTAQPAPPVATAPNAPLPVFANTGTDQTAGNETPKNADKVELVELKKQLEETNKKLAAMQQQLQQLNELLRGRPASSDAPALMGLVEEVRRLRDRLGEVEADLSKLRSQYSALSPTRGVPAVPAPVAGKALVRLVNDFPADVTMVLNGVTYRIPPRQTVDINVPAGEFSYQLLEAGGTLVRKPIREQEVVTLRIH
ncbi:MAG: hypothetical protein NZ703_11925 [Gemmataceae bacterium]|nr:hypothetical protein [Gemmataceae bacterium]